MKLDINALPKPPSGTAAKHWHDVALEALRQRDELMNALEASVRLFEEALPKFNWSASALDANAICLLNNVPRNVKEVLEKYR